MRSDRHKEIDAHVGRRLRLRRALLAMTQTALGQAVGVTYQQIQKYERGLSQIGAGRQFQFAELLDVPVPFFFDDMTSVVARRPPGETGDQGASGEEDQMSRRQTLELVRAYYRISYPRVRDRAREFVKLISDLVAGAEEEGE